jgi:uncharacterized membrane protein YkvA (DUF1232 family)
VLGYLDDLLLLPLGIWLAIRLLPAEVLVEARARAAQTLERPQSRAAAVVMVAIWIALSALAGWWLLKVL